MKTISRMGLGVALLALAPACGTETPPADNQALANEQNIMDNGLIVDPEIPNAAAETNGAVEPEVEPAGTNEPAAVKAAPVPPPPPKAKADPPKAAPKAAPKPEPSQPPKAECLPEHRAAGHC